MVLATIGFLRTPTSSRPSRSCVTVSNRSELCHQTEAVSSGSAAEDLGLDVGPHRKRVRVLSAALPDFAEVSAPSCNDIAGMPMNVLLGASGSSLWVELSAANIDYLRGCVAAEIADGTVKRAPPKASKPKEISEVV